MAWLRYDRDSTHLGCREDVIGSGVFVRLLGPAYRDRVVMYEMLSSRRVATSSCGGGSSSDDLLHGTISARRRQDVVCRRWSR